MPEHPLVTAEKQRLAVAARKIDENLAVVDGVQRLLAEHFNGPAADRMQANLRWRENQFRAVRDDLRRLAVRIETTPVVVSSVA